MRILFISAWFPFPPDNGSRIRAYNLMKALAARHEVYLVSMLQQDSDPAKADDCAFCRTVSTHPVKSFEPLGLKAILGLVSSKPRSFVDIYDPAVKRAVEAALEQVKPDALVASTLGVVDYVPAGLTIPTVLEQHNCEYAILKRATDAMRPGAARWRRELGWKKFAKWEAGVCRRFDAVTMVSDLDKETLLKAAPDLRRVHVVPNGVDTEHYTADGRAPEANVLVYNGALTYDANLDAVKYFASDIYPILAERLPGVRLVVTGRHDGVDLGGISDCPGIELVGYVPDIRDVLRRASACVVPLRHGGGSRLKILEAMAAGVPVVSTSMGVEGIDAEHGRHLLLAESPAEFAEAAHRLLAYPEETGEMTSRARALVENRYCWSAIGAEFARIVESAKMDA
jgi:glycosyltransferase involved in cell wall biosynthesis